MLDTKQPVFGFILIPRLTQLDLTGPYEVFSRVPGGSVNLIAANLDPISTESAMKILPDTTFENSPPLDVICVPGGAGVNGAMEDKNLLRFVQKQAASAKYVTSVCTGALVLGAAGSLKGYRATTHWLSHPMLNAFGATPVNERVVTDRNRITAGGITAGIDFGLTLVAQLRGEELARQIQLMMEYNPAPPFDCGSPQSADPATVDALRSKMSAFLESRRQIVERAAAKIH